MRFKKWIFIGFFLLVVAQWYVPISMIWQSESTLTEGKEYRFLTEPIDPTDPFRGKYVTLNFQQNTCEVTDTTEWTSGDIAFGKLHVRDSFAYISSLHRDPPVSADYIKVKIEYQNSITDSLRIVHFRFPFDRYYMEETKAPNAEIIYSQRSQDTSMPSYAVVYVHRGHARLSDVKIGDSSLREMADRR